MYVFVIFPLYFQGPVGSLLGGGGGVYSWNIGTATSSVKLQTAKITLKWVCIVTYHLHRLNCLRGQVLETSLLVWSVLSIALNESSQSLEFDTLSTLM